MGQYLLSTYGVESDARPTPPAPETPEVPDVTDVTESMEVTESMMQRVVALEAEMDATGTFVFGGHLHGPDAATVVHTSEAGVVMTDGPFAESKEHIAGFYIINADDLDAALSWAARVSECVGRPIEVQPFAGTGRAADQFPA